MNYWLIKNYLRHYFTSKKKGHGIHSPFVYQLCENVFYNNFDFYAFDKLHKIRKELSKAKIHFQVEDFGAGSKHFKDQSRSIASIINHGISTRPQSEMLFKLINYLQPNTILELGTSIGINTLYFSKAKRDAKIISIEAEKELVRFAKQLFSTEKAKNITLIEGKFDDVLPQLLEKEKPFDMIYIDGNHTYDATMRYTKLLLESTTKDSCIIYDDIYWSEGMTKAWNEIIADKKITISIDCFYFGIVFFRNESKQKEHFKLLL
ncbi:MAG: O-methyltransferase [Bacteroidia bacterium]